MNNHEKLVNMFKKYGHDKVLFISFDIGKYFHVSQVCNGYKEMLLPTYKFSSTESGYHGFKSILDAIIELIKPEQLIFGCEPSGTYYLNLMNQLILDYPTAEYRLINPVATAAQRKMAMERNKTDPIDANAVLELMLQGLSYPLPIQDHAFDELKEYVRYYDKLTKQVVGFKNRIHLCFDEIYPGFSISQSTLFDSIAGKQFLRVLPDPRKLKAMTLVDVLKYFEDAGEPLSALMAGRFSEAARDMLLPKKPIIMAKFDTLKGVIRQFELTEELRDQTKRKIESITMSFSFSESLLELKGLGALTLGRIIAYLNNPFRFSSGAQVSKYAGLAPRRSESGVYSSKETLSKVGHRQLRSVTIQLTHALISSTGYFTAFYNRLVIDKGKDVNLAVVATAHKVIRVLYHMMVTGDSFAPPTAIDPELAKGRIERLTKEKLKNYTKKGTALSLTQKNSSSEYLKRV
jgi:transposase